MKRFFLKAINCLGYDIAPIKASGYKELLSIQRYKPAEIRLLNNKFRIADGRSFYYSYQEIFTQEIYRFVSANDNPMIIDCGANYGTSVLYFKHIYPKARIVAFEADPYIFSFLKQNVEQHKLKDVKIYNLALWNEETTISFISEGADGGRITDDAKKSRNAVAVQTVCLSKYIGNSKIDMLKMDIEGAEYLVLEECADKLKQVENIFIEYHSFEGKKQKLDAILSILTKAGFTYQIHDQYSSSQPLFKRKTQLGMNLQLNIFGYRQRNED